MLIEKHFGIFLFSEVFFFKTSYKYFLSSFVKGGSSDLAATFKKDKLKNTKSVRIDQNKVFLFSIF